MLCSASQERRTTGWNSASHGFRAARCPCIAVVVAGHATTHDSGSRLLQNIVHVRKHLVNASISASFKSERPWSRLRAREKASKSSPCLSERPAPKLLAAGRRHQNAVCSGPTGKPSGLRKLEEGRLSCVRSDSLECGKATHGALVRYIYIIHIKHLRHPSNRSIPPGVSTGWSELSHVQRVRDDNSSPQRSPMESVPTGGLHSQQSNPFCT